MPTTKFRATVRGYFGLQHLTRTTSQMADMR